MKRNRSRTQQIRRLLLIWTVLLTGCAQALEVEEARHLLLRTGFGATPEGVEALLPLDRQSAVDRLLSGMRSQPVQPPPAGMDEAWPDRRTLRKLTQEERKALRRKRREQGMALKEWWYREMLVTPSPLTERMTLFWHGHFTSSLRKVRQPALMYDQNLLFRRHALGNFAELLHAVARDPAMILYLDNQTNRAGHPNENFARELLELFTLGEGNYSEQDVREAARAFTGWKADRRQRRFRFVRRQHDSGIKHFLGHSGRFDGDDIIDILLQQPQTARHLVSRLWRQFIVTPPDAATLAELADDFRKDWELKPLVRKILLSDAFWARDNRGSDIKPPVVLIVGTLRLLQLEPQKLRLLVRVGRQLGQDLFDPPNVKGWPRGTEWIDSNSLLARQTFMARLLRGNRRMGLAAGPALSRLAIRYDLQTLSRMLLAEPPVNGPSRTSGSETVAALLRDLSWQLM